MRDYHGPVLPPVTPEGLPKSLPGGPYWTPGGWRTQPPITGPGGGAGTPGIAPGGGTPGKASGPSLWDWLNPFDFWKDPAGTTKKFFDSGKAQGQAVAGDFWAGLGIIGGSVGVYLVLLLLFGLGVWGLLGAGGPVGYAAAPRPFRTPGK